MNVLTAGTALSRGGLPLFLRGPNGLPQDAIDVRWTVFHAAGMQASGLRLRAIRAAVGEYYAPWVADVPTGNYRIVWEWSPFHGGPAVSVEQAFFVMAPSDYDGHGKNPAPQPGGRAYLAGSLLGRGDLPLFLRGPDGMPADAQSVQWSILTSAGIAVTSPVAASNPAVGEYYAPWQVCGDTGDYVILWEFTTAGQPTQSTRMGFAVVRPAPYVEPCDCPCDCPD